MNISEYIKKAFEYKKNGDYANTEKICLEVLEKYPDNSTVLTFLGMMYYETFDFQSAEIYLTKAYCIKPDNIVIKMLAFVHYNLGNITEAETYLKLCTEFEKTPEIYNKLIDCITSNAMRKGRYGEAYPYSKYIYEKYPFNIENIVNLSEIYLNVGEFNKSSILCAKALSINPNYPKAWVQKGILEEVVNYDDIQARKCFKKALKLGGKADAYYNLCINYSHSDYKKSNYYGKALIKLSGENAGNKVRFIIGSNYLAMKKIKEGYKYLAKVWDGAPEEHYPYVKIVEDAWQGEPCENGTLFILCDIGYGDKIMFIRYLPLAAKKFKNVIIWCDKELLEIFNRSFAYLKNVQFAEYFEYYFPPHDKHIAASHLPAALNSSFYDIPYPNGYLTADDKKIETYSKKYFDTPKLKAGLCWEAGSFELRRLHNRNFMFSDLEKLLTLNDKIQFYSFQMHSVSVGRKTVKSKGIVDLSETIKTFDDTAALLKNLDVLITVDTSVAHIAGALGVNTLLFLPFYSEWRWFDNTDKTEWYDSIKIFKQIEPRTCHHEIDEIYKELTKMLK